MEQLSSEFKVSLNRVIRSLGISKSSVYYKPVEVKKKRKRSSQTLPKRVQEAISEITGNKATYGILRIKAILKRDYKITITKYLLHRYMKQNDLLVKRGSKRGSSRPHTGKISVEKSNKRWASDITSIKCWNGQKIRFSFILDCCDRTIISWYASKYIQGCDIELLFQNALYKRFSENEIEEM
ncbi:hypothetical protein MY04_4567 [Flammeovirga sp. MY04]|uniref:hypothetical protein n=1 Tax=Flammeovirga sp. MY04 TaxID=1191459 RepID=UPI00080612C6|nr:hypothetical protein [Flammeovirga sp. MY04]ANQ51902.1 hypothetical protein MY04_4567 [Flammeovirga sp. MY04]